MKTNSLWKTSLIGICLLASWQADAKDYYLAPGGTGNGMAIDKPFGDPIKAFAALKAGDVLYVRGAPIISQRPSTSRRRVLPTSASVSSPIPVMPSALSSTSPNSLAPMRLRLPPIVASCTR